MHSPLILEITNNFPANLRKDMDNLLSKQDYRAIWQTIEWQLMLQDTKYTKKGFFVGIYEERVLISYALVEKRSIGLGQDGFFCIGGPIGQDTDSGTILSQTLKKLAEKEGVVFVQVESLVPQGLPAFKPGEYKHFIEKHTALIDLTQDEQTILTRMKPKGRYNIRVAEKAMVTIEQVPYSEANLDIFYGLLSETLERDGFAANSREYFKTFLQYLEKQNLGGLFLARRKSQEPPEKLGNSYENQALEGGVLKSTTDDSAQIGVGSSHFAEVIAGGIFVYYQNTALYYYGASSSDNTKRKYMATYLLQWHAIQEGKKRGCKVFDFLGIADPRDAASPLAGVTDFKLKLTDQTRAWPDSELLVTRTLMYIILVLRKKLRKLITH